MADDAKSDKDRETEKAVSENGKVIKRGRGRPKKEATDKEETSRTRKYLGLDNMTYEDVFKGKDKLSRSPTGDKEGQKNKEAGRPESSERQWAAEGSRSHTPEEDVETEELEKREEVRIAEKQREKKTEEKESKTGGGKMSLHEENLANIVKELRERVSKLEDVVNELRIENIWIKKEAREESQKWEKEKGELIEEIKIIKGSVQLWSVEKESQLMKARR